MFSLSDISHFSTKHCHSRISKVQLSNLRLMSTQEEKKNRPVYSWDDHWLNHQSQIRHESLVTPLAFFSYFKQHKSVFKNFLPTQVFFFCHFLPKKFPLYAL